MKKKGESLVQAVDKMIDLTGQLLKPLKSLKDDQARAVVALFMLTRGVEQVSVTLKDRGTRAIGRFRKELGTVNMIISQICPDPPAGIPARDPCFEAQVAYISALAQCEEDGKGEEDCPEAWEQTGMLVQCAMEKVESARKTIEVILGGGRPIPRPDPWPWKSL